MFIYIIIFYMTPKMDSMSPHVDNVQDVDPPI